MWIRVQGKAQFGEKAERTRLAVMSFSSRRYDFDSTCAPIFGMKPTLWSMLKLGGYASQISGHDQQQGKSLA